MKKKLALLMAAMMTVSLVPVTAFASTKLTAVDEITTAVDDVFTSRVELVKDNDQVDIDQGGKFDVYATLTNGKFAYEDDNDDKEYAMDSVDGNATYDAESGIIAVDVISDTKAKVTLDEDTFNQSNGNSSKAWKEDWLSDSSNTDQVKADWIAANATDIEDEWKADYAADWKADASNISQLAIDLGHVPNETEINTAADDAADTAYDATAKADAEDAAYALVQDAEEEKAAAAAYKAANVEAGLADACVLPIIAKAVDNGEVVVTFTSNVSAFKKASEVIATAVDGDAEITVDGVKTFVEDASDNNKEIKEITINGLSNGAITKPITLKLKGNFKYTQLPKVTLLNDAAATANVKVKYDPDDAASIIITFDTAPKADQLAKITINGLKIEPTKKCDSGDVATITVSSEKNKDFSSVKLEVGKMVEEAVTYSVEDDDLPVIWAGKDYADDADANTLKVSVEENNGDILNTSRKATFTFPEGIEVVDLADRKGLRTEGTNTGDFKYEIDENVVTIYNYQKKDGESNKTDFDLNFILNAAPTFSGDVNVTLGGQFDDVTLKVATVKAPYTVEAKTTDVLIDYRYVPVNNIVITEAEEGILDDGDKIILAVEKMDFEDAGDIEITEGDIDADVDIEDDQLVITIKDASTEASTMTISGLELYLDRTLPVGGYALTNVRANNVLWGNSADNDEKGESNNKSYEFVPDANDASNGLFKYKELTINDSYVNVITAARDQDDSMTTKKIIITVGATTMTAGQETVTLDAPAYINAENYTMLPLRAITEAFGATVNWDDATRTVTILSGQRIISMTIGSKTMYINGTPVAMNTAPEIASDRTFVPVRDLANSLGISNINWTEASGTVTLN